MDLNLVVVRPFGRYDIGDRITTPTDVAAALASDHCGCVVPVLPPSPPTPEI